MIQQIQSEKAMIFIENLDQEILEDYLHRKFKEVGEIQSIKIFRDKRTQKSQGKACITFEHPDFADEAKKQFNNVVFIKNIIRVKSYFNYHKRIKEANLFINNLPEDANTLELEEQFSIYGIVLSVDIHKTGKALCYGYVQFERKQDADYLIASQEVKKIIYRGNVLKIEQFKSYSERKTESTSIHLRAFARPLNDNEINEEVIRAIEFAWQLLIKDFFIRNNVEVKDCFVKIDNINRQPWAMVDFGSADLARNNIDVCEKSRSHPCIRGSASKALELLQKQKDLVNYEETLNFYLADVTPFFEAQAKSQDDMFKGESENFFFNSGSNQKEPDDRLLLIQNIREEVSKEELTQFLGQFGNIIRLSVRKPKSARFPVQQCFVHYQTLEDSKRARYELYDDYNTEIVDQRKKIFKDGQVKMSILMNRALRKEFKKTKTRSKSILLNSTGKIIYQPMDQKSVQFKVRSQSIPNRIGKERVSRVSPPKTTQQPNMSQIDLYQQFSKQYRIPQMGMGQQRFPPQQQFRQHPFKQQGQMPLPQANPYKIFNSYQVVIDNFDNFSKLSTDIQRKILGNLLVIKIDSLTDKKHCIKKIVGMLVDDKQFEISEILNFLENETELNERVEEALELIQQNNQNE